MPHRDSTKGYSRHQFPSGACGSTRTLQPCHSSGCKPCGDLRTNLPKAPMGVSAQAPPAALHSSQRRHGRPKAAPFP